MATKTSSSVPAAQLRKIKKPMIERRRRERINDCLNQLKALVLEATHKDGSRYSKMEKADILEMTVSHLRTLHRRPKQHQQQSNQSSLPAQDTEKYIDGFKQCAVEVGRYFAVAEAASRSAKEQMATADSTTTPPLMIGTRLMRHLTSLLLSQQSPGVQRRRLHFQASLDQTVESFVKSVSVEDADSDSGSSSSFSTETFPDGRRFVDNDVAEKPELFPVLFREQINVLSSTIDNIKNETSTADSSQSNDLNSFATETPTTSTPSSATIIVPLYAIDPTSTSCVPLVFGERPTSSVDDESSIENLVAEFNAVHPGSPRQADEVPIHRQLTLVANSCHSLQQQQQQQQMFSPRSGFSICSSSSSSSAAATVSESDKIFGGSSNDMSYVPVCGVGKELCSGDVVWRPW